MTNKCGSCKWDYHCEKWEQLSGQGCDQYEEDTSLSAETKKKAEEDKNWSPW